MNNFDPLTRALEQNPGNDIVAAMLTDALIDEKDMTRSEADRVVTDVRRAGLDAAQMAEAAELIKPGAPNRIALLTAVYGTCGESPECASPVLLIPGDDQPLRHGLPGHHGRFWNSPIIFTVGAGWILNVQKINASSRKLGRRRPRDLVTFE
jgi:hypothetical protein